MSVRLVGGHEIAYAVWLESDLGTLRRAYEVWDEPAYISMTIEGTMANDLPPWPGVAIGAQVRSRPRSPDELPYVVGSSVPAVATMLSEAWDHDHVLRTLQSA